jgi:glycosyltransferase involved in cell wall biosynthesis
MHYCDDGSTDGSDHVVQRISDHRIRVINQSNAGVSAARNRGTLESKYEYLAFLDADDFWEPTFLEEMADFILSFPDAGLYGSAYNIVDGNRCIPVNFHLPIGFKGIIESYFKQANKYHLFCSSAVVIRKCVIDKTGFFDEKISLGEDIDYWVRIAMNNKVAFFNEVLSHYNTDVINRAMIRKHDFNYSILSHTSQYSIFEKGNDDFKIFINLFRIRHIPELLNKYDIGNQEIVSYLKEINPEGQRIKYRIFLFFPIWTQRIVIYLWKMYRKV